jgi:O-antigen ligase
VFVACGALATGALFFTFQRAAWVTAVIGLAAILIALPVRRRRRLLTLLLPTLVAAIGTVLILNAASVVQLENPLTAGLDRIESLTQFSQDSSNQHRVAEAHAAIKQIDAHPFTGIGLGNTITFISPLFNTATNQPGVVVNEFYIHNSYLWFPLKLGIPGAVVFITLIAVSLGLGVTAVRRLSSPNRKVLALGATLIVASLAVISTAGPHLNGDNTAPMLALAIATICLVRPAGERELPS